MDQYAPTGPVAHSGTFNAPLVCILGGLAFVEQIQLPAFWKTIHGLGDQLYAGLEEIAAASMPPTTPTPSASGDTWSVNRVVPTASTHQVRSPHMMRPA